MMERTNENWWFPGCWHRIVDVAPASSTYATSLISCTLFNPYWTRAAQRMGIANSYGRVRAPSKNTEHSERIWLREMELNEKWKAIVTSHNDTAQALAFPFAEAHARDWSSAQERGGDRRARVAPTFRVACSVDTTVVDL